MCSSEESPLLEGDRVHIPDDLDTVYSRFSKAQKNMVVFAVSFAGLLPMFVTGTFVPSIPQIAHDLDSTGTAVSLAVSLSVFANAIGGLVWSAYSSFYGRRPMYLWGMPILCMGSFGVAASTSLRWLLFWRFVQAFGCAGGVSVGAAAIGDIYKVEQRGTAMGIFFGACLLGVALSPITGGTAAHYWSWRSLQWSLGLWGFIEIETSHSRSGGISEPTAPFNFVWINPFSSIWLLRSPNIMAVTLANASAMVTEYVLLIPIAYTIVTVFLLFDMFRTQVASPIAGRLSDTMIEKWKARRKGIWVPEDRLRAVLVGGLLVPLSVCLSGLITTYIDGPWGLILNLLCFFMNGIGVSCKLVAFRAIILAPVTAAVLPSIETLGLVATNNIATMIAILGYGLIVLTIRYGDRMRAWVDVGYTVMDT
ncbi:major facilitator superfamily domain-containing protein [Suillus subluteus]|nr:major facilitator superfamily domain-containing protein [Suillus subluteus]